MNIALSFGSGLDKIDGARMKTTNDYLDACKSKLGLTSDYQLAKVFEVRQPTISNYRSGRSHFDDSMALKVAGILGLPAAQVMAAAHFERSKADEERSVWRDIFEKFGGMAAAVVLGVYLYVLPVDNVAQAAGINSGAVSRGVFGFFDLCVAAALVSVFWLLRGRAQTAGRKSDDLKIMRSQICAYDVTVGPFFPSCFRLAGIYCTVSAPCCANTDSSRQHNRFHQRITFRWDSLGSDCLEVLHAYPDLAGVSCLLAAVVVYLCG